MFPSFETAIRRRSGEERKVAGRRTDQRRGAAGIKGA